MEKQVLSCTISYNPLDTINPGEMMKFTPIPIDMCCLDNLNLGEIKWLNNLDGLQGVLLTLTFLEAGIHKIEGSAVVVAPGVALCATHVINDYFDKFKNNTCQAYCSGFSNQARQMWRVRNLISNRNSDTSILLLEYCAKEFPKENHFYQSIITTRLPKIGEPLLICGFRASEKKFLDLNHAGGMLVTKGLVTQRYPEGRDRYMIPWPALEVDCFSYGGMSGGGAFDMNGRLIGLLSSSISHDDRGLIGTSYISLLRIVLVTKFSPKWLKGVFPTDTSLLEIPRLCAIDGRSAFTIKEATPDSPRAFLFSDWE